jgi:hypothetical protein
MRTTLDIDDDVLAAAKELAAKERKTAGKILSEFFRRALHAPSATTSKAGAKKYLMKNGVPVLPLRGEVVTVEKVRRIMEDEGI